MGRRDGMKGLMRELQVLNRDWIESVNPAFIFLLITLKFTFLAIMVFALAEVYINTLPQPPPSMHSFFFSSSLKPQP